VLKGEKRRAILEGGTILTKGEDLHVKTLRVFSGG
jgi:hypothetical protein